MQWLGEKESCHQGRGKTATLAELSPSPCRRTSAAGTIESWKSALPLSLLRHQAMCARINFRLQPAAFEELQRACRQKQVKLLLNKRHFFGST